MSENEWKLPFNIAIGFHVLLILGVLYLPGLFKAKPKFADIYTVSLISITEPAAQPEPVVEETAVQSPQPVPVTPVAAKKIAPIAEPVEKPVPAPQKAISIKPLKKKKIKKIKKNSEDLRLKELERKRRKKLAEAIRAEEIAEDEARIAQKELERERNLMKTTETAAAPSVRKKSVPRKKIGGSSNLIQGQYNAAIFARLHQFWSLPEYMQKNSDLTAVVVITITKNGQIAHMFFENRSGNRAFDQFVEKTIEAANPLPPIPAAMRKQRYEIGLRFRPGSIL